MKLLYIDANAYLSHVGPTSDIKNLEKIKKLIQKKKINLLLPSQTKKEVLRHLKKRILREEKKIKKAGTQFPIPDEFKNKKKKYTKEEKIIIKEVKSLNLTLKKNKAKNIAEFKKHIVIIKKLIKEIFKLATLLECTDEIVLKAVIRYAKDLPPKKNNHKFGDAINWEIIKENIKNEDLAIVSYDGDYVGKKIGDKNKSKQIASEKILVSEWKKHAGKKLTFYRVLGQFINAIDKKETVSPEEIKKEIIQASGSAIISQNTAAAGIRYTTSNGNIIASSNLGDITDTGYTIINGNIVASSNLGDITGAGYVVNPNLVDITGAGYVVNPNLVDITGTGYTIINGNIVASSNLGDNAVCKKCKKPFTHYITSVNPMDICPECFAKDQK